MNRPKLEVTEEGKAIEFLGHDNFAYSIAKPYRGAGHVLVSRAPLGTLAGSPLIRTISVHIDDADSLCTAIMLMKGV